jgi:hypothetical protein
LQGRLPELHFSFVIQDEQFVAPDREVLQKPLCHGHFRHVRGWLEPRHNFSRKI